MERVIDEIDLEELARQDKNPGASVKWAKLVSMVRELSEHRVIVNGKATYPHTPVLAFANFFIDDFPMLGVAGMDGQGSALGIRITAGDARSAAAVEEGAPGGGLRASMNGHGRGR